MVDLPVSYFLLHLRTYDTKRVIFGPYQTVYYWAAYGIFMIFTYIIISSGEIWIRAKRGEKSTLHNCTCIQFPSLKKHLQYSIMQSFVLDTHNRLSSGGKYISSLVFSVFTSNLFLFDIPFIYNYHDNMLRMIGYWNVCRWPFYYQG